MQHKWVSGLMARYGLARHVFVCRDEDYIVVLDLRRDRYFALEAAKTAPLSLQLPGWPAPKPVSDTPADEVAAPLLRLGWLLDPSGASKEATPVQTPHPEVELIPDGDVASAKVELRIAAAFVAASIFAKLALRFWRFERVIQRVAERKAMCADTSQPFDLERARHLVDALGRMRVFLFSARQECLHDSLTVLEFLARHELFPNWVFGVRARPFAAHCWVQHGGVVFNDTVEHVSTYIPIMVV